MRKLLTKVRAHLRGAQEPSPDLLIFEYLSLNRITREVYRGNREIELTAK